MRNFPCTSTFIFLSIALAFGLSPIRDDCKSIMLNNSIRPYSSPHHNYSISPTGRWVFELSGYFAAGSGSNDSVQLYLFQYCYPPEHIWMTTLYARSSTREMGVNFMTDNEGFLGGTWNSNEDTVYFSVVLSNINTSDSVTEVFKLDVSSITGGLVKTTQQSLIPKLLKTSNYPNPFSRITNIEYSVPNEGYVAINIYNANGDLVKVLGQEKENQGLHHRIWDGKDNRGKPTADGIYYYQVISGDFISVKQIIKFR